MISYFVVFMKDYLRMSAELIPCWFFFFLNVAVDWQKQMRSFRRKAFLLMQGMYYLLASFQLADTYLKYIVWESKVNDGWILASYLIELLKKANLVKNESLQSCYQVSWWLGIEWLTPLSAPKDPLASPRGQPQDHSRKLLGERERRKTGRTWLRPVSDRL